MKIYKLEQSINNDYDTYDSVIVAAENEEEARKIHPSPFVTHIQDGLWHGTREHLEKSDAGYFYETNNHIYTPWVQVSEIGAIKVTLIGEAEPHVEKGVILASFNAG